MPTATATATKPADKPADGLQGLIEGLQANESSAIDAIKRFVDTVNDSFPDIGDDGPRRQVIDAAFKMTHQVVDASNRLAINLIDVTENALDGLGKASV
ncbi:MAG: hypothetical protein IPG97_00415 [Microthrixaceae bacterium]|jgi:hypothetical protein|nr:hypothetical protein [Microthrixaceae bacterium]